MSKTLVQKALYLLQEETEIVKSKGTKNHASMKTPRQAERNRSKTKASNKKQSGPLRGSKDKTEENLLILEQLRSLKPKPSVAQKVVEFYTKRKEYTKEPLGEKEPQTSILFDDDDDLKKKKKRKKLN